MASADLRKELECSICLNIYTDPVTLKCGHNFCRVCIARVLDTQEGSGGYSCPECREEFGERPALQRNITLNNIMENFLFAQPAQGPGVLCTYCIHTPVPAVISCLLCEASLCDNHVKVHSKTPEHILCDPTTSLESRKCPVHKKVLEYYCTEDSAYICVSCSLAGEHRGHQVETLNKAAEIKKSKMRNILQKLITKGEEMEGRVQSLQEHRRKVEEKAAGDTETVTVLFRDLRRHLEDLEKRVLSEISGKAERVSLSMSDLIQELEIKKEELSRKIHHIEELCNMADPLTVLQESDTGDLCDTEGGDDRERRDKLLHDGGDVAGVSHTLYTGLSDIISCLEKCIGKHVCPPSTPKDKASWPSTQPTPTIQPQAEGPNPGALQHKSRLSGAVDILLDVNTAGNYLYISNDRKSVSKLDKYRNRPETSERFQCPQVLSTRSFSSGRHYWEVNVGGSENWAVGMCYPSIERSGSQSAIGYNRESWGLRGYYNKFSVTYDSNRIPLHRNISSNRVGIDLDYEAGQISFYDLCDPIQHLHTFTVTLTKPLHAVLYVGTGCIKIMGGM